MNLKRTPHTRSWQLSAQACLIFALLLGSSLAQADDEFIGYGVEKYRGSSHGECSSTNLWWTIDQVKNFSKKFKKWNTWETVVLHSNKYVDGRDFTDASKDDYTGDNSCTCSSCSCLGNDAASGAGADHADVVIISTHGSTRNSKKDAYLVMGDNSNDCKTSWEQNMYWSTDTDILITEACHSADYTVWQNSNKTSRTGFYAGIKEDGQFRALLGYHGLSKDKSSLFSAPSFVSNSYDDAIVENWIVEMYGSSWKVKGTKAEICPTAIVFGESSSKTDNFAENGGFKDRKDTGDKSMSSYYYIGGCDPHKADALPQ
jgi:hypothetical protein